MWTDDDLHAVVRGFLATELPLERFAPHAAHLGVATVMCRHHPDDALVRMRDGIQALMAAHGVTGKYHETITRFYVERIHELLSELDTGQGDAPLANAVIARLGGDKEARVALFARYWTDPEAVLASDTARSEWVPPDLTDPDTPR